MLFLSSGCIEEVTVIKTKTPPKVNQEELEKVYAILRRLADKLPQSPEAE